MLNIEMDQSNYKQDFLILMEAAENQKKSVSHTFTKEFYSFFSCAFHFMLVIWGIIKMSDV